MWANPTRDLVLPTWSKLPRVVPTEAQAETLVSVPDPNTVLGKRDRAVLELLYGSGIRVSGCERLELEDLDLAQGILFVRNGKGRKDRAVPIAGRGALALESYLKEARPELARNSLERAAFGSPATGLAGGSKTPGEGFVAADRRRRPSWA